MNPDSSARIDPHSFRLLNGPHERTATHTHTHTHTIARHAATTPGIGIICIAISPLPLPPVSRLLSTISLAPAPVTLKSPPLRPRPPPFRPPSSSGGFSSPPAPPSSHLLWPSPGPVDSAAVAAACPFCCPSDTNFVQRFLFFKRIRRRTVSSSRAED